MGSIDNPVKYNKTLMKIFLLFGKNVKMFYKYIPRYKNGCEDIISEIVAFLYANTLMVINNQTSKELFINIVETYTDNLEEQEYLISRITFYTEMCTGKEKAIGFWLHTQNNNIPEGLNVIAAFGDNILSQDFVDNYSEAPLPIYDYYDTIYFTKKVMKKLDIILLNYLKKISKYTK